MKNGDIERGVVIGVGSAVFGLSGNREVRLTTERREDYRPDLGVWIVTRPRDEWTRQHDEIEMILVLDFNELKNPDKGDIP